VTLNFWINFGLSPNLGLSESLNERLIQKLKSLNASVCPSSVCDVIVAIGCVLEQKLLLSAYRKS